MCQGKMPLSVRERYEKMREQIEKRKIELIGQPQITCILLDVNK